MPRIFKSSAFAKAVRKADISDASLCAAIKEVFEGKCDNLGGGVYKKRLNKNEHRSIILGKGGNRGFTNIFFRKMHWTTLRREH